MGNRVSRPKIVIPPAPDKFLDGRRNGRHVHFHPQAKHKHAISSLYSIYGAIMTGNREQVRACMEEFFDQPKWTISNIDDPHDVDEKRYALIAAITFLLVDVFNQLIQAGPPQNAAANEANRKLEAALKKRAKRFQSVPKWAEDVTPLEESLVIPDGQEHSPTGKDDPNADPWMLKKNILTNELPTDLFSDAKG